MNLTKSAQILAKQYHKSDKSHTPVTTKDKVIINCYDKVLGHHTILAYKVIGRKNNTTGKVTMF